MADALAAFYNISFPINITTLFDEILVRRRNFCYTDQFQIGIQMSLCIVVICWVFVFLKI